MHPGRCDFGGGGNLAYSDFVWVPLSTVDRGNKAIGKQAGLVTLDLARSRDGLKPKSELISAHLVVRVSTLRVCRPTNRIGRKYVSETCRLHLWTPRTTRGEKSGPSVGVSAEHLPD